MTTPEQRNARAALDAARPAVARLDSTRGPEDLAADIIETWSAAEAALRALVGSTVLTGQTLIREARQRQMINFDQANSLAEFQAVRDRVQDATYHPTESDINSARAAFLRLDSALLLDPGAEQSRAMPNSTSRTADTVVTGQVKSGPLLGEPVGIVMPAPPRRVPVWAMVTLGVLIVVGIVGALVMRRGGGSSLQQGIDAYRRGQREVAVSAFNKAAREDPNSPLPHVFLARMAREVGNFTASSDELSLALKADPANATALREMGSNLLAQGNLELARRFYVRAVTADPTDKSAQGYLGCTLIRLNRVPEATNFLNRAGPGPWSNCTPPAGTAAGVRP